MVSPARPNRLAQETSPYLQQHAHNPVDWYPWGPEALERARREDKPIFMSIGYSTCHWCHVMAHECFENPAIAALLNEHFISIKVDREERPDLDETYMSAVHALGAQGGWPLNVFLTPDLQPFYGGTYFPPEDRGGRPGLPRLILALSQVYHQDRERVVELAGKVQDQVEAMAEVPGESRDPSREEVEAACKRLLQDFDFKHGGFGGAPKFPRAPELGFLLHCYRLTGDKDLLQKAAFTLGQMARGGIYDQLGGGFHRYTVDGAWVVPHFEKMLYDNALLVPLYLALFQLEGREEWSRIARETLDFVLRELTDPQGGFYSALDAESEGEEGKFYVWSLSGLEHTLGPELAPLAAEALGVTRQGNFEGHNVLTRPLPAAELAARFGLTGEQAAKQLEAAIAKLLRVRETRVRPHRDEKVITAWNGLMISALAQGAQVLGEPRYYQAAARAARFLLQELWQGDRLLRTWTRGRVSVHGFSEDYVFLAQALLDLYETDFDPAWLRLAGQLWVGLEEKFLDPEDGLYYYVAQDQEAPLVRSKSLYDQTMPSGNSMAARVSLRLHRYFEEDRFLQRGQAILRRLLEQAGQNPWGFAHLWQVAVLFLLPPLDLTLVGDLKQPQVEGMLRTAYRYFQPERRLLLKDPRDCAALEELAPAARTYSLMEGKPAAYLCQAFACLPPVHDHGELAAALERIHLNSS